MPQKKRNVYEFSLTDTTDASTSFKADFVAKWYDENEMGLSRVSNTKAQAVTLGNGSKAIRFLALVDENYADYDSAGFIISTECPTPTIEAGYQYSVQGTLYKKVWAMHPETKEGAYLDVAYIKNEIFGFEGGVGILYTNLTIKEGKEDIIYYATPYVQFEDGSYQYGKTKAISYNQLKALDAEAANAQ